MYLEIDSGTFCGAESEQSVLDSFWIFVVTNMWLCHKPGSTEISSIILSGE
jgi:hypothetical protein